MLPVSVGAAAGGDAAKLGGTTTVGALWCYRGPPTLLLGAALDASIVCPGHGAEALLQAGRGDGTRGRQR
jgi:hypothetical protein